MIKGKEINIFFIMMPIIVFALREVTFFHWSCEIRNDPRKGNQIFLFWCLLLLKIFLQIFITQTIYS